MDTFQVVSREPQALQWARGVKGLLGIPWEEKHGGLGRPLMDQYIFSEEIGRIGGLYTNSTAVNMVGPTITRVGTDEQQDEWIPKMLSGEVVVAVVFLWSYFLS
ncbi:MAG TPA: hypothetical protein EYN37_06300 [Dehalococcoidia bacterium]|nr:hypothetical protein [Dehalococcoidia bacterium]